MSRPIAVRPGGTFGALAGMLAAGAGTAVLLALLALPLAALLLHATPASLLSKLRDPLVLDALRLSLGTAAVSTLVAVLLGLPVAWLLATRSFPLKRFVEVLVELPMVLPPTVAGFALLLAFGRAGLVGRELTALGVHLPFTTLGVIVAQVFMSAPFFISAAAAGIASVDRRYLEIASTLRSSEWSTLLRVVLPLSLPSLAAGATMCCARALGEFGATITFAGNLRGVTQTMPLAVYMALESDLDGAVALSIILVAISAGLLWGLRRLRSGLFWRSDDAARRAD